MKEEGGGGGSEIFSTSKEGAPTAWAVGAALQFEQLLKKLDL